MSRYVCYKSTGTDELFTDSGSHSFLLVTPPSGVRITAEQALQLAAELTAWAKPEAEGQYVVFRSNPIGTLTEALESAKMRGSECYVAKVLYKISPGEPKVEKL